MINILILADYVVGGGAETQLIEEMAILQNISNLFFISASEVRGDDLPSRVTYLGMLSQNSKEPLLAEVAIRKINLVHLHNVWHPCWYGFLRQLSLPKVMTLHDYRLVCPSGWQVRPKEVTRCKNRGIIACTTSGCLTKNHRKETGATYYWWLYAQYLKTNVSVFLTTNMDLILELQKEGCANAAYVNLPMINPPSFSTHKRERLVIFAGNLGVHKGVHRLILTIKALRELDRSIRFIFAGDGKLREYLKTEIESAKIDNVEVLGFFQRPALIELLGTAALTYLPSKWQENFNLVSRESRLRYWYRLLRDTSGDLN
jgi:glycosyltransferase involved in cell wall biosynthesis